MHSWQGYCSVYNKSNSKVQGRLHLASSLIASLLGQSLACWGPNAASWRAELNRPTAGAGWLTGDETREPLGPSRWRSLAHLAITLRPPALATTM